MKYYPNDDSIRSDKKLRNNKRDLYKKLAAQIDHIHRVIVILRTEELKSMELTFAQITILLRIWSCNDNISPAELSRDLLRKPNTISIILKRMISAGLVQKRPDPSQKHSYLLSVTPRGQTLLHRHTSSKFMKNVFSKFSDEELFKLAESLHKLDAVSKNELSLLQQMPGYGGGNGDYPDAD